MKNNAALDLKLRVLFGWFLPSVVLWTLLAASFMRSSVEFGVDAPSQIYLAAAAIVPVANAWVVVPKFESARAAFGVGLIVPALVFAALFRLS